MFVHSDGTVTGSVNWSRLEELVKARSDEVTADGWAAVDATLAGRNQGPAKKSPAKKAEPKAPEKGAASEAATAPAKKAEPEKAPAKK